MRLCVGETPKHTGIGPCSRVSLSISKSGAGPVNEKRDSWRLIIVISSPEGPSMVDRPNSLASVCHRFLINWLISAFLCMPYLWDLSFNISITYFSWTFHLVQNIGMNTNRCIKMIQNSTWFAFVSRYSWRSLPSNPSRSFSKKRGCSDHRFIASCKRSKIHVLW